MIKNDLFKVHLYGENTLVDVWLSKTICLLNVNLQVAKNGNLRKARDVYVAEIGGNFYSTNPNESAYGVVSHGTYPKNIGKLVTQMTCLK